ncbi:MAG: hypothetical protein GXY17_11615 [Clostridiaceae bacterium]|nr:hypothetical protein [Clostridiaceae bacterium]NLV37309.1 hypothetical protein [Clostridiaceae bacterium]
MKKYIKPVFEKVELMPHERLSTTSACNKEEIWCDKDGDGTLEHSFFALN